MDGRKAVSENGMESKRNETRARILSAASKLLTAAMDIEIVLLDFLAEKPDMTISLIARDAALAVLSDSPLQSSNSPERALAITLRASLDRGVSVLDCRALAAEGMARIAWRTS